MTRNLVSDRNDQHQSRQWLGWLLLLPLPGIAFAVWSQALLKNIGSDYLWMLVFGSVGMVLSGGLLWVFARRRLGIMAIPTMAAILVAVAFVYYAGPAAAAATILLVLAAIGVGTGIDAAHAMSPWLRLLIGLAALAALVGWLLPFPVHDSRVYLLLVAVIGLLRFDAISRQVVVTAAAWRDLASSNTAWLTLVVVAVAVGTLGLWLPSLNFDDNAVHLILPDQLMADGYYHLDVSSQVWAVAPWSNDVLHGIAALLAGQEVRASVNLLWLLIGVSGAYRLAIAMGSSRAVALAAAGVFATHPLTAYFGTSMQVDGVVAAVLLHFSAILAEEKGRSATPVSVGVLLGLLAGLKASNSIYVLLPLCWLAWNGAKRREWGRLFTILATAIVVGGSSYAYATIITGNPLFPLFNGVFQSPYLSLHNFHDTRWDSGVDWRFLWDLTFNAPRFGEHYPGAAGIALLAVISGVCVELLRRGSGRWIGLWFLASGLLLFSQIQYLRYVFPAIAVLTTVGLVGLGRHVRGGVFAFVVFLIVSANAILIPTTDPIAHDNPWQRLVIEGKSAQAEIERSLTPERALLVRLHVNYPKACALMTDEPFVGSFSGRANTMAWYDPRLAEARKWAESDRSGIRWQKVLQSVGASHVVLRRQSDTPLMKAFDAIGYIRVDSQGDAEVWANAMPDKRECDPFLRRQRDQARRLFSQWGLD